MKANDFHKLKHDFATVPVNGTNSNTEQDFINALGTINEKNTTYIDLLRN